MPDPNPPGVPGSEPASRVTTIAHVPTTDGEPPPPVADLMRVAVMLRRLALVVLDQRDVIARVPQLQTMVCEVTNVISAATGLLEPERGEEALGAIARTYDKMFPKSKEVFRL